MKLLFDLTACQALGKTTCHGGGIYGKIVFFNLLKRFNDFSCIYDSSRLLEKDIQDACLRNNLMLYDIKQECLQNLLYRSSFDIFYSALPYHYGKINWGKTVCLGTIHGLRPLEIFNDSYEYIYTTNWKSFLKARLKNSFFSVYLYQRRYREFDQLFRNKNFKYIAVSHHTKNSILSFYPYIRQENIKVLYSPSTVNNEMTAVKNDREKYYLMVSGNRWLKNSFRAICAFDQLFTERKDFKGKVIITGCPNSQKIRKKLRCPELFDFRGYVSQVELLSLYQNAYAFVYPSLNEGFGYPPLEAMRFGTPVLTSSFSAITEVCGEAVIYFNPYSVSEIKNRLLYMEDITLRQQLCKKSIERFNFIYNKQQNDLDDLIDFILDPCVNR